MKMNKKILLTGVLAATMLIFSGCGTSFVAIEPLELPKNKYVDTGDKMDIAFAIARPDFTIKTDISSSLERGTKRRLLYASNEISCHLTDEIERMLVAKGITITDVFESRGAMTFTQKKETTALLYPRITIKLIQDSDTVYQGRQELKTSGDLMVKFDVSIVMVEPLSGEKVWVKHLYSNKETLELEYKGQILTNKSTTKIQKNLALIMKDIDEQLVKVDNQILAAISQHVTKSEFKYINDDIKKLKGIKRY